MKMKKALAVGAMLMLPMTGFAASDGILDVTSTGTMDVKIILGNVVKISGLQDIDFGIVNVANLTADLSDSSDFCVYTNETDGKYDVTISSVNSMNVKNNNNDLIPYSLDWHNNADTTSIVAAATGITQNQKLTAMANANKTQSECTDTGNTTAVKVTFNLTDLQNANNGVYSDTITFLVSAR